MASLLDRLLGNRFADLKGLRISGTVPIQEDLINEALEQLVQGWSPPKTSEKPPVDSAMLLTNVKKIKVRAEQGVVTVDFEVQV